MIKLDNNKFIARHHRGVELSDETGKTRRKLVIVIISIVLYIIICIVVALMMNIPKTAVVVSGAAFVFAALLSFFAQKALNIHSNKDKERLLLREVLEGSRGARLITDSVDQPVYFNHSFEELCKTIGKPSLMVLTQLFSNDEETMAHFRLLADQAHRGLTDSIELRSAQGEGENWFMVTAQPVAGWAGYIHWRIDDITNKRRDDRAVRDEREKLIDFTDNAPVGFFSVDETGQFVFVNATLARWLGEDIQSLLSSGHLHIYFDVPPEGAAAYDVISAGGAKQMAEVLMKGPGGQTFMASISQTVVHESDGTVRTRGVVHDLTAERAMRQALKASEDRFQRFFEEAPLGIAMLNKDGVLADVNVALANVLGTTVEALEGRHFEAVIEENDRNGAIGALDRIQKGNQSELPMEVTLIGHDRNVATQMFARKFKGDDGVVLHFSDLTEQKVLEQQFVQSQKMQAIGQLAGGIAHDFNNLLTAMIGFCDLLMLRHKAGDASFSDIMQIKQNANRAANLVRQLLAFSRQQTLRPKVQDITDILTELSHLIRRLIGANIDLDVVHGSELGLVKVDAGQMEQVLINLAVNARDAMEGGGRLTIATSGFTTREPVQTAGDIMPPGHWVRIDVTDTGCGIPEENFDRILEPFFTTKEVGQGTGLGLATVYGIIRQTGGYLMLQSTVGEGTTFSIFLPQSNETEAEVDTTPVIEEDTTRDLTGTARILLVEDEDAVRTFSSRALANKGYEVLDAESGEAALAVMEQQENKNIDLMITDVIMPNMDGPTLAQRMRQTSPNLKIIFISGYTEEKLKDHMGPNIWFLPKPFTLKQLAAKVKEALEG
jgi:two-component system cell cycle sensor histidine kinase/response regulator CckA